MRNGRYTPRCELTLSYLNQVLTNWASLQDNASDRKISFPFLPCDAVCTVSVIVILSVCPSVCLSVSLSHSWTVSTWFGQTYDHDFFTTGQPHHSSFWGYHDHPKIRRGSPRARALNEGGWVRIGDFRPISRRISETVRDTTKVTINH